jgi:hypothetical protein
MVALS